MDAGVGLYIVDDETSLHIVVYYFSISFNFWLGLETKKKEEGRSKIRHQGRVIAMTDHNYSIVCVLLVSERNLR